MPRAGAGEQNICGSKLRISVAQGGYLRKYKKSLVDFGTLRRYKKNREKKKHVMI